MSPIALRALADAADALARLARAALDEVPGEPSAIVPIVEAARVAGTSVRVVRDAIRAGDLTAYGKQRDRGVRRRDLDVWIETRQLRPVAGVDDADMDRRVRRLVAGRR